jgi:sigma-B regulation protein RsbU (phosphoserine phosphatase)
MHSRFTRNQTAPSPPEPPLHSDVPELREAAIAALYYGQRQAGDFYDFIRVHPQRVLFGLLDAAGTLEDTRAILSAAQHTFRTLGATLFAEDDINEADAMSELCHQLNRTVLDAAKGVHSCPAFTGCYNEGLGILCYCNSGHTPGLVRDSTGAVELAATGLPLGLFSHATSDALMVALEPGADLLLVSRGVVEGKRHGEEFGLNRVKELFQNTQADTAKEICMSALDGIRQFMGTAPTHDDVTALALARAPRGAGAEGVPAKSPA